MYRLIIISLFCLSSLQVFSQNTNEEKNKENKVEFKVKLSSRRTFISNKNASLLGLRMGLMFHKKYEVGIGVYSSGFFNLKKNVLNVPKFIIDEGNGETRPGIADIGFGYVSLYGEYVFLNRKKWILTANSQYGLGVGVLDLKELDGAFIHEIRVKKNFIEHSVKATYALTTWFDLIGGFGYRYLLNENEVIREAFTSPIYIISFNIDFFDLYKTTFKKKK